MSRLRRRSRARTAHRVKLLFPRLIHQTVKKMNNPPIGTCGENEVAYKCPLGGQLAVDMQDQTVARWTFEVVAELDERTNGTGTEPETTQCTQGQYVQGTRKTDGNGTDNPPTEDEPPAGSIKLGGFHFHAVGKGDRYTKFGSFDYRAD